MVLAGVRGRQMLRAPDTFPTSGISAVTVDELEGLACFMVI